MDWKNTTFGQNGDSVPDSCCILDAEDCGKGILNLPDEVITVNISECLNLFYFIEIECWKQNDYLFTF